MDTPTEKKIGLTIRLPEPEMQMLAEIAKTRRRSKSVVIRDLIEEEYQRKHEAKGKGREE